MMTASDLGGAGDDAHRHEAPCSCVLGHPANRLHTVNAVARGFSAFWAAEWTTVMQPTKSQPGTKAPDVFQRDQIARAGWRAMPPKDLELQRLSPTAAKQADATGSGKQTQSRPINRSALLRTSTNPPRSRS